MTTTTMYAAESLAAKPPARPRKVTLSTPYHACWYPVALSADLQPSEVTGTDFLGSRIVIYRTASGIAQVKSAYCRHLGADLAVGSVKGERLQCAFHHWEYDAAGRCAFIPAGDHPPRAATLYSFPTAESLGIIWAFNGAEPTYEVPSFGPSAIAVDSFRNPREMKVSSDVVFLNSFDIQHFRAIHNLDIHVIEGSTKREPSRYLYSADVVAAEFGAVRQDRILWGVNVVTIATSRDGRPLFLLHALCPNGPDRTTGFLVNALGADPAGTVDPAADAATLETMRGFSLRLVIEDAPIFDTIRFRSDCLTKSDEFLAFGLRYIDSFAEAAPGSTA